MDGVYFKNLTIGHITFCGSSAFVYNPPHSAHASCLPGREKGATMIDVGMGYAGAEAWGAALIPTYASWREGGVWVRRVPPFFETFKKHKTQDGVM